MIGQEAGAVRLFSDTATRSAVLPRVQSLHRHEAQSGSQDLRFSSNDHYTRVVVEVDRETDYEFNRLSRPARLYFDLFGARLATDLRNSPPLAVNDERIKQIRLGQYRRTTARVVFDLGSPVRYRASWLANPPRFVVEVGLSKNDAFVAETIDSPSSARNPSAALPGPGKAGEIALAETKDPARPRQPRATKSSGGTQGRRAAGWPSNRGR